MSGPARNVHGDVSRVQAFLVFGHVKRCRGVHGDMCLLRNRNTERHEHLTDPVVTVIREEFWPQVSADTLVRAKGPVRPDRAAWLQRFGGVPSCAEGLEH